MKHDETLPCKFVGECELWADNIPHEKLAVLNQQNQNGQHNQPNFYHMCHMLCLFHLFPTKNKFFFHRYKVLPWVQFLYCPTKIPPKKYFLVRWGRSKERLML